MWEINIAYNNYGRIIVYKKMEKQWNIYRRRLDYKINWICGIGEVDPFGQGGK